MNFHNQFDPKLLNAKISWRFSWKKLLICPNTIFLFSVGKSFFKFKCSIFSYICHKKNWYLLSIMSIENIQIWKNMFVYFILIRSLNVKIDWKFQFHFVQKPPKQLTTYSIFLLKNSLKLLRSFLWKKNHQSFYFFSVFGIFTANFPTKWCFSGNIFQI